MNAKRSVFRFERSLLRFGMIAMIALGCANLGRGELLFERQEGGPNEWRGGFQRHVAGFELFEPTRITGILGYFFGGEGRVTLEIRGDPTASETPTDFESISFDLRPNTPLPNGQFATSGIWEGVDGLHRDFDPGHYILVIDGDRSGMPYAYGHIGPPTEARLFDYFQSSNHGSDILEGAPFAARIYGTPLIAIPEPASYGLAASLLLLMTTLLFRRGHTLRSHT